MSTRAATSPDLATCTDDAMARLARSLNDAVTAVQEMGHPLAALRAVAALADAWEAEAAEPLRGEAGLAREAVLWEHASALRKALEKGGLP